MIRNSYKKTQLGCYKIKTETLLLRGSKNVKYIYVFSVLLIEVSRYSFIPQTVVLFSFDFQKLCLTLALNNNSYN